MAYCVVEEVIQLKKSHILVHCSGFRIILGLSPYIMADIKFSRYSMASINPRDDDYMGHTEHRFTSRGMTKEVLLSHVIPVFAFVHHIYIRFQMGKIQIFLM